jgi:plastocyanin
VKPSGRVNHPADQCVNIDMRWLLRAVALALAATAVAACGSSSGSGGEGSSGPTPAGSGPVITIKGFGYGAPLTVAPGTTVTVRQEDPVQHDVSSATFRTPLLGRGGTATFTAPTEPGSYDFTCSVHPQMHGRLIVRAGAGPGGSVPGGPVPGDSGSPGSSDAGSGPGGY